MVEDCSWESVSSSPIHLQQWNNPTLTSWWLMSCWCSKQVLFWKIKLKSFAMRWSSLSGGENDHYLWLNTRKERRKSSYTIKLLCRKKRQKRRTEPKEFRKKTRMRKGEGRQMGGDRKWFVGEYFFVYFYWCYFILYCLVPSFLYSIFFIIVSANFLFFLTCPAAEQTDTTSPLVLDRFYSYYKGYETPDREGVYL